VTQRERIEAYFRACTRGDAREIASHFTPQAVVYDTNHKPVAGAEEIGRFWARIAAQWDGAAWFVDTCVSEGESAAIEWTMTGRADKRPFAVRGSEHYAFAGGRIAQIRQYWTFDRERLDSALREYPYQSDARFHSAGELGRTGGAS